MANIFYIRNLGDATAAQRLVNSMIGQSGQPDLLTAWGNEAGLYAFNDDGSLISGNAGTVLGEANTLYLTAGLRESADAEGNDTLDFDGAGGDDTYVVTAGFGDVAGDSSMASINLVDIQGTNTVRLENGLVITGISQDLTTTTISFANGASIVVSGGSMGGTPPLFQVGGGASVTLADFLTEVGFTGGSFAGRDDGGTGTTINYTYTPDINPAGSPEVQAFVEWNGIRFEFDDGEAANNGRMIDFRGNGTTFRDASGRLEVPRNMPFSHEAFVTAFNDSRHYPGITATSTASDPSAEMITVPNPRPIMLTFAGGEAAEDNTDTSVALDGIGGRISVGRFQSTDDLSASGSLADSTGDTTGFSVTDENQGDYGRLTIDNDGVWSYTLDRSRVSQAIDRGTTPSSDTVTITVTDGANTATYDLQITLSVTPPNAGDITLSGSNTRGNIDGGDNTQIETSAIFSTGNYRAAVAEDFTVYEVENGVRGTESTRFAVVENTGIGSANNPWRLVLQAGNAIRADEEDDSAENQNTQIHLEVTVSTLGVESTHRLVRLTVEAPDPANNTAPMIMGLDANYPIADAADAITDGITNQTIGVMDNFGDSHNFAITAQAGTTTTLGTGDLASGIQVLHDGTVYGTLTLNTNTGVWGFAPDQANVNALPAGGDPITLNLTAVVTDSQNATGEQNFTITISGANDTPTASGGVASIANTATHTFATNQFGYDDAEGDALASITITSLPDDATMGTLELSDGDATNPTYTAITDADLPRTINADQIANLRFDPVDAFNGTATFTYTVNDGNSNSAAATFTITVAATASTAPVLNHQTGDGRVMVGEDMGETVTGTLTFRDVGDNPTANDAIGIFAVAETNADPSMPPAGPSMSGLPPLPSNGIIVGEYGNFTLTRNDTAGTITWEYTTTSDRSALDPGESLYEQLTVVVADAQNNESDTPDTRLTIVVQIRGENDAPFVTNPTATTDEDTALSFAADDFNFDDPNPGDTLASITIVTPPSSLLGRLELSDGDATNPTYTAVTADQVIDAGDIPNLRFVPTTSLSDGASTTASFTFTVSDGSLSNAVARPFTITITGTNDAPTASGGTATTLEDTAFTFPSNLGQQGTLFGFADADGQALDSITIETLPSSGTLELSDGDATNPTYTAVRAGQVIPAQPTGSEPDNHIGNLRFTPTADSTADATFTYTVSDGTTSSATAASFTFTITPVDDEASITLAATSVTSIVETDSAATAIIGTIVVTDPDTTYTAADLRVREGETIGGNFRGDVVDTTSGRFVIEGTADANTFNLAIRAGVAFDHETASTLDLTVEVGGETSTRSTSIRLTIGDIDDEPTTLTVAPITTSILENADTSTAITIATLTVADPDTDPLPSLALTNDFDGRFRLEGNQLQVAPDAMFDFSATPSYMLEVTAGAATETITFTIVEFQNQNPVIGGDMMITVAEGGSVGITNNPDRVGVGINILNATDADSDDALLLYTINAGDLSNIDGEIRVAGMALTADANTFTQDDVNAGRVAFHHDGSEPRATPITFGYTVSDAQGGSATGTFTINVRGVDDPTMIEGLAATADLPENSPVGTVIDTFTITDPDGGTLNIITNDARFAVVATANANEFELRTTSSAAFNFELGQPDLTVNITANGTLLGSIIVSITDVNEAPITPGNAGVDATEEVNYTTFTLADFGGDPDAGDDAGLMITFNSLPDATLGTLSFSDGGAALAVDTAFSVSRIDSLVFTPVVDATGTATFTYTLTDADGLGSDGDDFGGVSDPTTFTISIANVDDAATITVTPTALSIPEDAGAGVEIARLVVNDIDSAFPTPTITAGNDGNNFILVQETMDDMGNPVSLAGQWILQTNTSARFDFDRGQRSFELTVSAGDATPQTVTVMITNVIEDPILNYATGTTNNGAVISDDNFESASGTLTFTVDSGIMANAVTFTAVTEAFTESPTITDDRMPAGSFMALGSLGEIAGTNGTFTILPDRDTGTVTWSFVSNDNASLTDGEVRFELLTLQINDGMGNTDTITVLIEIRGDDDATVINNLLSTATIAENSAGGSTVATFSVSDVDTDSIPMPTVSDARFEIVGTGTVNEYRLQTSDTAVFDFETEGNTPIMLTVNANGTEQTVAVTLQNVVEGPSLGYADGDGNDGAVVGDNDGFASGTLTYGVDSSLDINNVMITAVSRGSTTAPTEAATSGFVAPSTGQNNFGDIAGGMNGIFTLFPDATNGTIGWLFTGFNRATLRPGDTLYEQLTVQVSDGTNTDTITVVIQINGDNDAPTALGGTVTAVQGVAYTFQLSDFAFNDPDDSAYASVTIAPAFSDAQGVLRLRENGNNNVVDFSNRQSIEVTAAQISNGDLTFTATVDNIDLSTSLVYSVTDSGGLSSPNNTLNINAAVPNNQPIITTSADTVAEGGTLTLTTTNLAVTDEDSTSLTYEVREQVADGELRLIDAADNTVFTVLVGGGTFTQADLEAGRVQYVHDGSEPASAIDFDFIVSDGENTPTQGNFRITVTNVNDAPMASNGRVNAMEDVDFEGFILADFGRDPDAGDVLTVTFTSLPDARLGVLRFGDGTAFALNTAYNAARIEDLVFTPVANANGTATVGYTLTDRDNETATGTLTINIAAVNDAPTAPATLTTDSTTIAKTTDAGTATITIAEFSDVENDTLTYTAGLVGGEALPTGFAFDAATRQITVDTMAVVAGSYNVEVTATDASGSNSAATATLTITVNTPPTAGQTGSVTISEDAAYSSFTAADFGTDPDGDTIETITITTPADFVGRLSFTDSGAAFDVGEAFSVNRLGSLVFTPDNRTADYDAVFQYTVSDGTNSSTPADFTISVTADNDPTTVTHRSGFPATVVPNGENGVSADGLSRQFTVSENADSRAGGIGVSSQVFFSDVDSTITRYEVNYQSLTALPTGPAGDDVAYRTLALGQNQNVFSGGFGDVTFNISARESDGRIWWDATIRDGIIDSLTEGETRYEQLTIRATVDDGTVTKVSIVIVINGENDAPTITGVADATVTDAPNSATGANVVSGTFDATDPDNTSHSFSITARAGTTITGTNFTAGVLVGDGSTNYGRLTLDSSTGAWEFTPDQDAVNALDDRDITLDLTATADDRASANNQNSADFTITIDGANDAPTFTQPADFAIVKGQTQTIDLSQVFSDVDSSTITYGASVGAVGANPFAITNQFGFSFDGTVVTIDTSVMQLGIGASRVLELTANDGTNTVTTGRFTVTVLDPDTAAPMQRGDNAAEVNDGGTVNLTSNDLNAVDESDPPFNVTYTITSGPSHGEIITIGTGTGATTFNQAHVNTSSLDMSTVRVQYRHNGNDETSDSFTYTVADSAGNVSAPMTFNIAINQAPTLASITGGTVADTAGDDSVTPPTATGTLSANDGNIGDVVSFDITGQSGTMVTGNANDGFVVSQGGTEYGTISLTAPSNSAGTTTSTWTFEADGANLNALDETRDITLNLMATASDGTLTSTAQNFAITLNGADDTTTLTVTAGVTTTAEGTIATPITIATFTVTDPDDTPRPSLQAGVDNRFEIVDGASAGQFILRTVAGAVFDYETVADRSFELVVMAGTAPAQNISFTVTDTNDTAPTLSIGAGNGTMVTEAVDSTDDTTIMGTLTATDADGTGEMLAFEGRRNGATGDYAASITGEYGTLTLTATTWSYALNNANAAVNALNPTSTALMDVFQIRSTDGTNMSGAETLTITINGANDSPTVTGTVAAASFTEDTGARVVDISGLTFTDPDASDSVSLSVASVTDSGGNAIDGFTLSGTDLSVPTDSLEVGEYTVTIRGTDTAGLTVDATEFTVTITADPNTFNLSQLGILRQGQVNLFGGGVTQSTEHVLRAGDQLASATDRTAEFRLLDRVDADPNDDEVDVVNTTRGWYRITEVNGDRITIDPTRLGGRTYTLTEGDAGDRFVFGETFNILDGAGNTVETITFYSRQIIGAEAPAVTVTVTGADADNDNNAATFTLAETLNTAETNIATLTVAGAENTRVSNFNISDDRFEIVQATDGSGTAIADTFTLRLREGQVFDFETGPDADIDTDGRQITVEVVVRGASQQFTITITDVNEAPVTPTNTGTDFAVTEDDDTDTTATGTVSATDPDGTTPMYRFVGGGQTADGTYGSITLDEATGVWTYTIGAGADALGGDTATGTDSFMIEAFDAGTPALVSSPLAINITVTGANDAPTAVTLDSLTAEGAIDTGIMVGTLDATDVDVSDSHTFTISGADAARFEVRNDNELFLIGGASMTRDFTITITATDQGSATVSTDFTIAYTAPNQAPTRTAVMPVNQMADEGGTLAGYDIRNLFADPDGDDTALTFAYTVMRDGSVVTPSWLTFTDGVFAIAADATDDAEVGVYQISVTASDSDNATSPAAEFTLTINNVNEAPATPINTGTDLTVTEDDDTDTTATGTVSAPDPDAGDTPMYRFVGGGQTAMGTYGSITLNATTGVWTYTIGAGADALGGDTANGTDSFMIEAFDGTLASATPLEITITITGTNDAPTTPTLNAGGDNAVTEGDNADTMASGQLAATDVDNDDNSLTFALATGTNAMGTYGSLMLNTDGSWTYTIEETARTRDAFNTLTDGNTATDSFMIVANDGTNDSASAFMLDITVNGAGVFNASPTLTVDSTIGIDAGEPFVLTDRHLDASDAEDDDASLTYTLTAQDAPMTLQRNDAGVWTNIAIDGTFTQGDVDMGLIRLNPMNADNTPVTSDGAFTVRVADSGGLTATAVVNFALRTEGVVTSATLGGGSFGLSDSDAQDLANALDIISQGLGGAISQNDLDQANTRLDELRTANSAPLSIQTGFGDNRITSGSGDDVIDAGLGDDVVNLGLGGDDEVIYRFEVSGDGGFIARDGGDRISGFTPGIDAITFHRVGGTSESFIDGLGDDFQVRFDYALTARGDGTDLMHYDVTGIEIHFPQGVVLPGGKLSGSILAIDFATPMAWADFNTQYLANNAEGTPYAEGAFDAANLQLASNAAGREALSRLLGASVEADSSRGVIIGTEGVDTGANALTATGEVVILGRGGDDTITLDTGASTVAQEVVYTLQDDGTDTTSTDGRDTIMNFTLGTDTLRFVDTMDEAPTLEQLLGRFDGVSLSTNAGGDYTGITLTIDDTTGSEASVAINFASALTESALIGRLDGIADATALNNILGTADGDGNRTIQAQYVDDLFASNPAMPDDEISITNTLPTELL